MSASVPGLVTGSRFRSKCREAPGRRTGVALEEQIATDVVGQARACGKLQNAGFVIPDRGCSWKQAATGALLIHAEADRDGDGVPLLLVCPSRASGTTRSLAG